MRIIACGNRERQDDGAGFLVAERLRSFGIPVETCSGEATALLDAWRGAEDVVLVDAVVAGSPTGTVHVWDGDVPRFALFARFSSHGLGVAEAIAVAGVLGRLPQHLRIYGIEARGFDQGHAVSPAVEAAAEDVASRIAAALDGAQCA
jgi:hydrogenase maturation protease